LFDDIMREGALRGQYPQAQGDIEKFVVDSKAFHRGNFAPMERLLPDGRWVLITERRTPDGGVVGIRTDITPLKRAMQELARARDAARAAGEAKSQFLARMSHELRTPLNGILGFSELLLEDQRLEGDQLEKVQNLHGAGKHLLELVNGLLDLSKIESGRMEFTARVFRLQDIIQSCTAIVSPDITRKMLELTVNFDPRLPSHVMGDPTRLRQIILNLLSNAVKFTPGGGGIFFRAMHRPGDRLRIEVQDTGPGISAEDQRLLFQDFVQIATMTQSEVLGTGLGLAITSRLVKQMGGEIGCESKPGTGSLFWFEIPLEVVAPPARKPDEAEPHPGAAAPGQRLKVLVVDDVKMNRDIVGALLANIGHDVVFATSGADALQKVQGAEFDLVLMDLQMPYMDGFDAARAIRAMPPPKGRLPIFALTASVMPEQIEAAHQAGMNGHIGKPLSRSALLTALAGLSDPTLKLAAPSQPQATEALLERAEPAVLDVRVLETLRGELKGAAAGVVREFLVEIRTIRDGFARELAEGSLLGDMVAANAHRLLGAARTLGALGLCARINELQKRLPRDRAALGAEEVAILATVVAAADEALHHLEAYFQTHLIGEQV
jgi:signal transduction histidine kinase/CheY-like chemotaxis protein